MDYITITGLKIFAHHGVLPEEKENGQDFYVNATLYLDCRTAGKSDALSDALNYADACAFMTEEFQKTSYDLIECAAEKLCQALLLHYTQLTRVKLTLEKPHAPIEQPFGNVSVTMERAWHQVYLSFGSNMGDKRAYITQGIEEIKSHPEIRNVRVSKLIETAPYGYVEQDSFLNGCLYLETLLLQEELLAFLHEVEAHANRKRVIVWGPRTLDMDIVFYDKEMYESADLVIPHIDMQNREFVLAPLVTLCPNYRHPVLGLTVSELFKKVQGIQGSQGKETEEK